MRVARSCASRFILLGVYQLAILGCGGAPALSEPGGNGTSSERAPAEDFGPSYLRVRNETELDLESVTVEESLEYGALAAGEQSGYSLVDYLYGTALIEAVSGDFRLMYVPVDHVGEKPAPPGYYTYALHRAPVEWRTSGFPDVQWVRVELLEDAAPR
jgi:hypothetical protein